MASKPPKSSAAVPDHALADVGSVIEAQVLVVRGQRVLLAQQLAALYAVETKVLNQAVQRNLDRFPQDFMFRLEREDLAALRSQTVTLNAQVLESKEFLVASGLAGTRGSHSKYTSYAFTEQGVAMLSSILKSERAIAVNIEIMRTFVKLRSMLSEHSDLKRKLNSLEKKYDDNFKMVFDAIHQMMDEPGPGAYGRRRIGFTKEK
jgi:2-phospho-L-lactate guanylyltransferase (CobY/MobA/RfbA family)